MSRSVNWRLEPGNPKVTAASLGTSKTMEPDGANNAVRFLFCLMPEFSMLSLCTALEPLRIANRISGQTLFDWALCAESADVASSLGFGVPIQDGLPKVTRRDTVFVCAGPSVEHSYSNALLGWLRRASVQGASLGGLCTGSHVLAMAGLLDGKEATIHWEQHDSFQERFTETDLCMAPYKIDDKRYSTAGGVAAIDLMLTLIAEHAGPVLAQEVSAQLMYTQVHVVQATTTINATNRAGILHPQLRSVIALMEETLEEPLNISDFSRHVKMSSRHLERLFRRHLSKSPLQYYTELRLIRARNLLYQTSMSVTEICAACGFQSQSSFSKKYRAKFGNSPTEVRHSKVVDLSTEASHKARV